MFFQRKLTSMGTIGVHRMVHRKYDSLALGLLDLTFQLEHQPFSGFYNTIFINGRMSVPIYKIPLGVYNYQLYGLAYVNAFEWASVFWKKTVFTKRFLDVLFLQTHTCHPTGIPFMVTGNENGLTIEIFNRFNLGIEHVFCSTSILMFYMGKTGRINIISQKQGIIVFGVFIRNILVKCCQSLRHPIHRR